MVFSSNLHDFFTDMFTCGQVLLKFQKYSLENDEVTTKRNRCMMNGTPCTSELTVSFSLFQDSAALGWLGPVLAAKTISKYCPNKNVRILDVCAGTGAVAQEVN